MKNIVLKITFFTSLLLLSMTLLAKAADVTVSTYYPSLSGNYTMYRLLPRSSDLTGSCTPGALYVNSASIPQFCKDRDANGIGDWGGIPGIWEQNADLIYLSDGVTNPSLTVGVGTTIPTYKLTLLGDSGIIAQGTFGSGNTLTVSGAGTRLIWYPRKAAFRAGSVSGSQWDDSNIANYSAALGRNSTASGNYSVVGGGDGNTASGQYSAVIGGQTNMASGDYSSVIGGKANTSSASHTVILGGESNSAVMNFSSIGAGKSNTANGQHSNIVGGISNNITVRHSTITGGTTNSITALCAPGVTTYYSSIGGGGNNYIGNKLSTISGGKNNTAIGDTSTIGGGFNNTVGSNSSCTIQGTYSSIWGGQNNQVLTNYSHIIGGSNNIIGIGADLSTIGGGYQNQIAAGNNGTSSITGGARNQVLGAMSPGVFILGGSDNTCSSGACQAEGKYTQVTAASSNIFAWGYSDSANSVTAPDSFVIVPGVLSGGSNWNPKFGLRDINPVGVMEINSNGTTDDYINITKTTSGDIFVIKNNGYIGVNKPTPTLGTHLMQFGNASNAFLSSGGVWTNGSSRDKKKDIRTLSSQDAESFLDQLTPVTYNYRLTPNQVSTGFIAEDVPDALALEGRKSLSSMDIIAVLTKVAQDQQAQIEQETQRIEKIKKDIIKLKKILGDQDD